MDRPDYLDEDDEFQEAVKAERSKILRAKRNRAQTLRSPSVSSALARAGTIQMTELKNGPSRKPLRNGLAQVVSFDIALLPETIVPWVADIAERMQYPPDFVPIPAMVALGAVRALCKHTSPTTRPAAAAGPMAASERLPNGRPPDSRIRDASQPILNGLSRSSRRSRAQQPAGIRPRCLSDISPKQRWADSPPISRMTLAGLSSSKRRRRIMRTEFENGDGVVAFPLARQKRKQKLEEKQAREEHGLEQLEKIAAFIEDAMTRFLPETPGKPIVDLTLSSPEAPSKIVLRIDDNGKVIDVSDEPFPF